MENDAGFFVDNPQSMNLFLMRLLTSLVAVDIGVAICGALRNVPHCPLDFRLIFFSHFRDTQTLTFDSIWLPIN